MDKMIDRVDRIIEHEEWDIVENKDKVIVLGIAGYVEFMEELSAKYGTDKKCYPVMYKGFRIAVLTSAYEGQTIKVAK